MPERTTPDYEVHFFIEASFSTALLLLMWYYDLESPVYEAFLVALVVMLLRTMYSWLKWDEELSAKGGGHL